MSAYDVKYGPNGILTEYDAEPAGLIRMIAVVSGRVLEREIGEEQNESNPDYLRDGIYVALFSGGVGIMVEYEGVQQGYSSWTPGSPARVEYSVLRKKVNA